jgi:transposase InsO family protein
MPAQALQAIPIMWHFTIWELDMVGPLSKAPGGFTHLPVTVDKFAKWIEARPIMSIKSAQAAAFFQDIIHRFGVPNSIIMDNGTNFTGKKFLEFCDDHHIRVDWAAVAHPRTNGQVERAMGRGTPGHPVGLEDNSKPGHRVHAILHGVRLRSHFAYRSGIWLPEGEGLQRARVRRRPAGRHGPA